MVAPISAASVDGVLVQWGDRLFFPANRIVPAGLPPRLSTSLQHKAAEIRRRIEATVTRRAPQVFVKVTAGGKGMVAIGRHFRYISKAGRLPFEDDRGAVRKGRVALLNLAETWRHGGSQIGDTSRRSEALHVTLSMPRGTNAQAVLQAAREFARIELTDHRSVMVLHEHQENPHVHLCVRRESLDGQRLYPSEADLHRWRNTFAERLRGLGIDAEATRQSTRLQSRRFEQLWQIQARKQERLKKEPPTQQSGDAFSRSRNRAMQAWAHIAAALGASERAEDRQLAVRIRSFVLETAYVRDHERSRDQEVPVGQDPRGVGSREGTSRDVDSHGVRSRAANRLLTRDRSEPEISR